MKSILPNGTFAYCINGKGETVILQEVTKMKTKLSCPKVATHDERLLLEPHQVGEKFNPLHHHYKCECCFLGYKETQDTPQNLRGKEYCETCAAVCKEDILEAQAQEELFGKSENR